MKQRTLARAVSIQGNGLHTGNPVTLTLKPAPVGHGIVFKRMDLSGQPEIKPRIDLIGDLVRNTTVQDGHTKIHLVEHVLSALSGCGVDNVLVEIDSSEPPIMDGSAAPFVFLLQSVGIEEQSAAKKFIRVKKVVEVKGNKCSHTPRNRSIDISQLINCLRITTEVTFYF